MFKKREKFHKKPSPLESVIDKEVCERKKMEAHEYKGSRNVVSFYCFIMKLILTINAYLSDRPKPLWK